MRPNNILSDIDEVTCQNLKYIQNEKPVEQFVYRAIIRNKMFYLIWADF